MLVSLVWTMDGVMGVKAQAAPVETAPAQVFTNTVLLPFVANDFGVTAYRMGYGATTGPITRYPEIGSMKAGWYTDWGSSVNPARPGGMEYAQMIRVHQKLACGDYYNANRTACPYVQPPAYNFTPDQATIQAIAQANPGSIWLIGNEMDRLDFNACTLYEGNVCKNFIPLGQDEISPNAYALAYHDLYTIVKAADPTARVAIGGLIQPTPLRLQWLTIAWDTYHSTYNEDMPVDIWNIHNFILREVKGEYGAEVPPGLPKNPTKGEYTKDDWTHIDHTIFDKQIRAMRQWMKDRGQQQKPLVVSEYGVLYSHCVKTVNKVCTQDLGNEQVTQDFMLWTFDYFLNTKDCDLGYGDDDCRLVQRWLWFSLDHTATLENGTLSFGANPHASLYNSTNRQMLSAGQKFRQYVLDHFDQLAQ
ncbi:MAG: hypothetical protein NT075_00690 [Chloroflexi bacterium]|nr:hypothetical protein [Chloroflexota bacterium]